MSFEACLAHVATAYGERMSQDGARRVMERVDERAQRLEATGGYDRADALRLAVEQLRAEDDAAAMVAKRNQALNLRLRISQVNIGSEPLSIPERHGDAVAERIE